jgi:heme exporter protein D
VDGLIAYFNMDGYAVFVWPSYALAAVVMIGLFVFVRATLRREERTLAQLQAAGVGRRRRARAGADQPPGEGVGQNDAARGSVRDRAGPDGDGRALDEAPLPDDGGRA